MNLNNIKPYINIENALYSYKQMTNGSAVKFKKPSSLSNWEDCLSKCLMVIKFRKTLESCKYEINKKYIIKESGKFFLDQFAIQISEDRSNYTINFSFGAGFYHISINDRFQDLYHEMSFSKLPEEIKERIKKVLSELASK